jgi:hypothetical protein
MVSKSGRRNLVRRDHEEEQEQKEGRKGTGEKQGDCR